MLNMKAPAGSTSCTHDGVEFPINGTGNVHVPESACADLMSHGYVVAEDQTAPDNGAAEAEAKALAEAEAKALAEANKKKGGGK